MMEEKPGIRRILFGHINRKLIILFVLAAFALTLFGTSVFYTKMSEMASEKYAATGLPSLPGVGQKEIIKMSAVLLVAIMAAAGVLGFLIADRISKPINELHAATLELEKGNFRARVDIKTGDEIERLGDAFNRTTAALGRLDQEHKELEKAKTELLSITSHELRSPMTPMKAQLEMVLGNYFGKINKKQRESLEIVLRNTKSLDGMIQDFLELSRIEAARLNFKFVKTGLRAYIRQVINEMEGYLPEKKIKITLRLQKIPAFEMDPDRVMQILRNLLNNAKKFSPPGRRVFVEAKMQGKEILFSVRDKGIGISPENQKRLFEPFFQAEQTIYREHGGAGLGLTICRGIVEAQNGKIWVESAIGTGSTFYFTLPLKPVMETKPVMLLFSSKK